MVDKHGAIGGWHLLHNSDHVSLVQWHCNLCFLPFGTTLVRDHRIYGRVYLNETACASSIVNCPGTAFRRTHSQRSFTPLCNFLWIKHKFRLNQCSFTQYLHTLRRSDMAIFLPLMSSLRGNVCFPVRKWHPVHKTIYQHMRVHCACYFLTDISVVMFKMGFENRS